MSLNAYSIAYSGGYYTGSVPAAMTFAKLGVTAAKIVSVAGGGDYAEITVDTSVTQAGMPFLPMAQHAIYDSAGALRFVGWLLQPARVGTANRQQQTFRLDGPSCLLAGKVFQQPWSFAVTPTIYTSTLAPQSIPRVLLNRQDYAAGTRINVAAQVKEVLDFAISAGVPITYGSMAAIPSVQPPEDEQTDTYCDTIIQRQLRYVPMVTASWYYASLTPQMIFSANAAVSIVTGSGAGAVTIPPGTGYISEPGSGAVLIDLASGKIVNFRSQARYDLLVSKVTIFYQAEQEVTDDGSITGNRKLWATLAQEVSTATNGSPREITYCYDLRGAGGARDATTGLPRTAQEPQPEGLAASLHDPFKVLTHSLSWSVIGADVEWTTQVGFAVGVQHAGDDQLNGARSIVQKITRDIGTGTTSYEAGPPSQLGLNDLVALTRFNRTRNAARNGGASHGGAYSKGGGPDQKNTGEKQTGDAGGTGGALGPNWFNCAVNGASAFVLINAGVPVAILPAGVPPAY